MVLSLLPGDSARGSVRLADMGAYTRYGVETGRILASLDGTIRILVDGRRSDILRKLADPET
jgi:hypothetical protein